MACWELHHGILISLAALALDRGQLARAKELAARVAQRNETQALSHDLHRCRANRILGKVALGEAQLDAAVQRLEYALSVASELDDTLERARCVHFLAQALIARGDVDAANDCKLECQQLLT